MEQLGDSDELVVATIGSRCFDTRDLLGFIDGMVNPVRRTVPELILITAEDGDVVVGGTCVVVRKYLRDCRDRVVRRQGSKKRLLGG